jgi:hypothetical protein
VAQAWLVVGVVLCTLGRLAVALHWEGEVGQRLGSRGGLLVEKARQRINQIRFGT